MVAQLSMVFTLTYEVTNLIQYFIDTQNNIFMKS